VLTSKLIDGTFPDYQRVIPTGNDKELIIDRQTSLTGRRPRLDHLVRARPRGEAVDRRGQLTLAVNNPDSGSADEELAPTTRTIRSRSASTQSYLLDIAVPARQRHEARFMLADPGSPTLIHDTPTRTRSTC
jgi:DNA polymerase-3 subunit beta